MEIKKYFTKQEIPWIAVILIVTLLAFIVLPYSSKSKVPFIQIIVFFVFLIASTLLARHAKQNRDDQESKPYFKLSGILIFVAISYLYIFLIELFANANSWITSGWFIPHMTYHVFNNSFGIIFPVFLLGVVLQRYKLGIISFIATFAAGLLFVFLSPNPVQDHINLIGQIMNGLLFVWVYHFTWLYTTLFRRNQESW
ncbi:hypothetical protein ACFL0X_00990 [Nanoarchaeota archaeon]